MEKVVISEFERDDGLDAQKILRAIEEIPFGVGKNLLIDYLRGDYSNSSIRNNCLDDLKSFGSLLISKEDLLIKIDYLIENGYLIVEGSEENRFMKLLNLTQKGKKRLESSTVSETKKIYEGLTEVSITLKDEMIFKELESFLGKFNVEQKKAIIHDKENILCLAGAGSGKTTVLVKRIEFLVKYRGVEPQKILAITFTRKAKEEMASRLADLGIRTNVETFNSYCEKILQNHSREIYTRPTRIIRYQEKIMAISMALIKMKISIDEAIGIYFSKNQLRSKTRDELLNLFMNDCFTILEYFKTVSKEIYDFSVECEEKEVAKAKLVYNICKELETFMKMQGLRDFNDQLIDVLKFFDKQKDKVPHYEHILVDEYQDVNASQIQLLEILKKNNLFCVGDPRQSIFGWRGSDINYILNFTRRHEESDVIVLKKNYRSSLKIVEFMNHSIKYMGLADLESHKEDKSEIALMKFESDLEEYQFVLNMIRNFNGKRRDIFVLARTNKQINELAEIFKKNEIKYLLKNDDGQGSFEARDDEVTLATIHSIKGLEARSVFVVGCNEANFPCRASDHPIMELIKINDYDKEEEERRLFYVAISRAKERLYLSYTGKKKTYFINKDMEKVVNYNE